jgi:hypothetical protein
VIINQLNEEALVCDTYLEDEKKHFMSNVCAKASKGISTPSTPASRIQFAIGGKKCAASRLGLNFFGFITCVDKGCHCIVAGAEYRD